MTKENEIPDRPIFAGVDIKNIEAGRLAAMVDNEFYTSQSVTRAINVFVPREDDILMAVNPRTGDDLLLRLLSLINARDDEEFNVVVDQSESKVPWIESVYVNGDLEKINADQPGSRRIFKTHMTHQTERLQRKNPPYLITMLRHPLDVRVSWYKHLRECYRQCGGSGGGNFFEQTYTYDAFVDVPATTSHVMPQAKILTYEHTVLEWYKLAEKYPKKVLALFYEDVIRNPKTTIEKISTFLDAHIAPARLESILKVLTTEELVFPISDESTFLFVSGGVARSGSDVSASTSKTSAVGGTGRARAETVSGQNAYLYSEYRSLEKMWEAWKRATETVKWLKDAPSTYEDLFRMGTGLTYPFPKTYPPKPIKTGPLQRMVSKCVIM